MRALVLGIAIALVALAALLLIPSGGAGGGAGGGEDGISFGRPAIATFGGKQSAVFFASGGNAGTEKWIAQASPEPFTQAAYWEGGASAGAGNRELVRDALDRGLAAGGLETLDAKAEFPQGRCALVAASGAFPEKIANAALEGSFPKYGQTLIYVGVVDGSRLGGRGEVSPDAQLAKALSHGRQNAEGTLEFAMASGGKIIAYPKVPEEYDAEWLGNDIASQILLLENPAQAGREKQAGAKDGIITLPMDFNKSYFRAVGMHGKEIVKVRYFGPESALPGEIAGGEEASEGAVYSVAADMGKSSRENLEMRITAEGKTPDFDWSRRIGEANQSRRFVGAAKIEKWPAPPWAMLTLEDQYGREYARGFVLVPSLEARMIYDGGREKEFALLKNGEPLQGGSVLARKNSGEWAEVALSGGKAVVGSKWAAGKNTVEFESNGAKAELTFEEGGGQAAFYLRYGVPALALAALLIIALAPKEQKKYAIGYGRQAAAGEETISMRQEELAALALDAQEELGRGALTEREINRRIFSQRGLLASDGTMKRALALLVKNGLMREYGGYYAVVKNNGGTKKAGRHGGGAEGGVDIRKIALGRRLADWLVLQGIAAVWKNGALVCGKGKDARAWFLDADALANGLKKYPSATLVFESGEGEEKWRRGFMFGSRGDSETALALRTGKLDTLVLPE